MFTLRSPSPERLARFIAAQESTPLSYANVGMTRGPAPREFNVDRVREQIGAGSVGFEKASEALRRWVPQTQSWVRLTPAERLPEFGATVVISARVGLTWWTNPVRIVYTIDETEPVRCFGFAYGSVLGHIEQGEARFSVELVADGGVWFEMLIYSRPRHWLSRLGYPVSRWYQKQFARGAVVAMRRAVSAMG